MINAEKLVTDNLVSINSDMKSVWQGSASTELCSSLDSLTTDMNNVIDQIAIYNTALSLLELYKEKVSQIKDYEDKIAYEEANPSLKTTEEYVENGKTLSRTVYVVNQKLIDSYKACIAQLEIEKQEIKTEIQGFLALLTGIDVESSSTGGPGFVIPENELSYEDALELANKLCVPVEYIIGLHLHEGYELGDSLIPEGITPDLIHYAGPNGYPILIGGIADLGDRYRADAPERNTYFIKTDGNFSAVGEGKEYNMMGWPITFEELDINYNYNGKEGDVYWTWYGPKVQGALYGVGTQAIICTPEFYPCDDGFYRDEDGYIVLAGNPYINQYDNGAINYEANGGLEYEETFIVTPFGLGRFYDNTEQKVPNGISADLYMNDGYESNSIAQTEAGRRLRESAVEGYESLNLYWSDMVH